MIKTIAITAMLACSIELQAQQQKPVYLNPKAPIEERVKDALSRMTLREKRLEQMGRSGLDQRLYRSFPFADLPDGNMEYRLERTLWKRRERRVCFSQQAYFTGTWHHDCPYTAERTQL